MRITLHGHHNGDPEKHPHVHVDDGENRKNSFRIDNGDCLQNKIDISKTAYAWFKEEYSRNKYDWQKRWDRSKADN